MNISENGIKLIQRYEGLRLKAYKAIPSEQYYTIGYGHYGSDVKAGQTITQAQADQLFRQDIQKFVYGVNNALDGTKVSQSQFDAMVSLAYNIGLGAFRSSTLLKEVKEKNFAGASNEFLRWNKAGGNVLAGLTKRREEEKKLFLGGAVVGGVPAAASPLGNIDLDGLAEKVTNLNSDQMVKFALIGLAVVGVTRILD